GARRPLHARAGSRRPVRGRDAGVRHLPRPRRGGAEPAAGRGRQLMPDEPTAPTPAPAPPPGPPAPVSTPQPPAPREPGRGVSGKTIAVTFAVILALAAVMVVAYKVKESGLPPAWMDFERV